MVVEIRGVRERDFPPRKAPRGEEYQGTTFVVPHALNMTGL